jgi:thiosulfate reductase cytochrome b subunit
MKHLREKHPRAIRWFHWINFPLLALMIWSGTLIYWANSVYRIGVGDVTLVPFYPSWFYSLFGIDHRLAEGMSWHFLFMWLFAINGVAYLLYTIVSGEWRHLVPRRHALRDALQVTLHELRLTRTPLPPSAEKYNAAQRLAYSAIVVMGAGSLVTGLAIYKPVQLAWLTSALGGYDAARVEHFALTIGYVLFFVVHIMQVVRAGWNNFRSMVMGYEVTTTEERHG